MALNLVYEPGQTPLDLDEAAQLIPQHIIHLGALNEWEQLNIQRAHRWLERPSKKPTVLTEAFCRELHLRMFNKTWKWAGKFRQSDKNLGCDWTQISARLNQLLGNTQYWFANNTFPVDEAATRFHHALVLVHGFPNGNGRHARLMTDCLLRQYGTAPFSWGSETLLGEGTARQSYLLCLRAADAGDFSGLLQFVRS